MDKKPLDEKTLNKIRLEKLYLKEKFFEKLNLPKDIKIIGMNNMDEIPLGGQLVYKEPTILILENKKKERSYLVVNKDLEKIASISKDNQIILEEKGQQVFEKIIGEEDKQNEQQKAIYDYSKEYFLEKDEEEIDKIREKDVKLRVKKEEIKPKQQDYFKIKLSELLHIDTENILSYTEINQPEIFDDIVYDEIKEKNKYYLVRCKDGVMFFISDNGKELKQEENLEIFKSKDIHNKEYDIIRNRENPEKYIIINDREKDENFEENQELETKEKEENLIENGEKTNANQEETERLIAIDRLLEIEKELEYIETKNDIDELDINKIESLLKERDDILSSLGYNKEITVQLVEEERERTIEPDNHYN